MISWLKEYAGLMLLRVGVIVTLGSWKFIQGRVNTSSIFRKHPDRSPLGKWQATGEDLEVEDHLRYSFRLRYTGELTFANRFGIMKVSGRIEGVKLRVEEKGIAAEGSKTLAEEELGWDLDGRAFLVADYLVVLYNQAHKRYENAFGCLFLKLKSYGGEAEGYFLAKRSIEDKIGNVQGIGFGRVVLKQI